MWQIEASKIRKRIKMFAVASTYLKKNIRYGQMDFIHKKNFHDVAEMLLRIPVQIS